jgi:hypothetical protein
VTPTDSLSTPDSPQQQSPQGPGPAGAPISPMEGQPDPNAEAITMVRDIVATARRLGMKYPAAIAEVREINNAVQRLQQKIVQSRPSPEPLAPPV